MGRSLSHNSQEYNDQKTFELVYVTEVIMIRELGRNARACFTMQSEQMICTTNIDVTLFLEKSSCIKLLFYN